jgi:hypothetical protein
VRDGMVAAADVKRLFFRCADNNVIYTPVGQISL